jgi:hypothetical protein
MNLRPDHESRPLWVAPNGHIFLEVPYEYSTDTGTDAVTGIYFTCCMMYRYRYSDPDQHWIGFLDSDLNPIPNADPARIERKTEAKDRKFIIKK